MVIEKGLCELARVTKRGGRIIVEFRNADNPFLSLAFRNAESYDPTLRGLPLIQYSMKQIRTMLTRAGLKIKHIETIGLPVKPLIINYVLETIHKR